MIDLPQIFMYSHIQANKDIYTLKYLKQFQHPTQPTTKAIKKISNFTCSCSQDILMKDVKLIARTMTYYLKRNRPSWSNTAQAQINQLVCKLKKRCKEMPENKPSLLSYVSARSMRNFTSGVCELGVGQCEQMKKNDGSVKEHMSLTYLNYSHQQQFTLVLQATNQLCLKIAQNNYQLPNPTCIGCSEYFYQGSHAYSFPMVQYSTLREGQLIKNTGQYCMIVGYSNNLVIEDDLSKAIAVGLSYGGGVVFVANQSSNKIQGILWDNYTIQNVYQKIMQSISVIKPSLQQKLYSIQLLSVLSSNFLGFSNISSTPYQQKHQKFIFKIRLKPSRNTIIKSNKSSFMFYQKVNNKIVQIYEQNIYEQIIGIYLNQFRQNVICRCRTCAITAYPEFNLSYFLKNSQESKDNNIVKEFVEYDVIAEQPIFKYKNYTVLAISSKKHQADLISKIRQQLKARKIVATLNKPYRKYTTLAERVIWFLSHDCQFNYLNGIIKLLDIESKSRAIVVTKFLQFKDFVKKEKLQRMQSALRYLYPTALINFQTRFESVDPNKTTKKSLFTYYGFQEQKHSVFAYIYLDTMGERAAFINQYHFKYEHKGKK